MIEKRNNFFTEFDNYTYQAIVCTTNNVLNNKDELILGAGIALEFKKQFTFLPRELGKRLIKLNAVYPSKYNPVLIITILNKKLIPFHIFTFPTKYHWKDQSDMKLIENSAQKLLELCDIMGLEKILMTRPGCGNGGLKWEDVKPVISFLDDRFVVINK